MIKCNFCEKPAIRNYQKIWVSWFIKQKEETYAENPRVELDIEEPIEDDNVHVCKEHEQLWLDGKI